MNLKCKTIVTICSALLGGLVCPPAVPQQTSLSKARVDRVAMMKKLFPDTYTRRTVKTIRAAHVVKMSFYGPDFGRWQNDPLDVKDQKTIRRVLLSLSHAEAPYLGTADRDDTLLIYTKSLKAGQYPPCFDFNPKHPGSCFGPEFYRLVNARFKFGREKGLYRLTQNL